MAITLTDSRIKKKLSQFGYVGNYSNIYDLEEDSASRRSIKNFVLQSKGSSSTGRRTLPPVKITPKNDHLKSSTTHVTQIYKVNSDDLNRKHVKKKVKKSVLTLPNQRTAKPQDHTVSDTNDSDYALKSRDFISKKPPLECEQSSWSNTNSNTKRNMKNTRAAQSPKNRKRRSKVEQSNDNAQFKHHNIWGVLRSMNRFQFPRSPPLSDAESDRTKKGNSKKNFKYDSEEDVDMDTEIYGVGVEIKQKSSEYSRNTGSGSTVIETGDSNITLTKQAKVTFSERTAFVPKGLKQLNKANPNLSRRKKESAQGFRTNEAETAKENKYEIHHRAELAKDLLRDGNKISRKIKFIAGQDTNKNSFKNNLRPEVRIKTDANQIRNGIKPPMVVSNKKLLYQHKQKEIDSLFDNFSVKCEARKIPEIKWSLFDTNSNSRINMRENSRAEKENPDLKQPPSGVRAQVANPTPRGRPLLTVTEIKRKLETTRFPIIITDKNEVCSRFQASNFDHFTGIDKNIWPFMVDWVHRTKCCDKNNIDQSKALVKSSAPLNQTKNNFNNSEYKSLRKEPKRNSRLASKDNQHVTTIASMGQENKNKPMDKLHDNMVKVLYKNSSAEYYLRPNRIVLPDQQLEEKSVKSNYIQPKPLTALIPPDGKKIIVAETSNNQKAISIKKTISNQRTNILEIADKPADEDRPHLEQKPRRLASSWPKASWASDFIETVISKIKKGIYCTSENITAVKNSKQAIKENSINDSAIQTSCDDVNAINEVYESDDDDAGQFYDAENDPLKEIDGFDKVISEVEVRSITKDTIVMKSFVANVVLHFDVVLAINNLEKNLAPAFVAVGKTDNTNIVKCSATIVNAILPAQLCALIPSMVQGLKELADSKQFDVSPTVPEKHLKPDLLPIAVAPTCLELVPIELAPKHAKLVNGIFSPKLEAISEPKFYPKTINYHDCSGVELVKELGVCKMTLSSISLDDLALLLKFPSLSAPPTIEQVTEPEQVIEPELVTEPAQAQPLELCKALVLYSPQEHSLMRLVEWEIIWKSLIILYKNFKHKIVQQRQGSSRALPNCVVPEEKIETAEPLTQEKTVSVKSVLKTKSSNKKLNRKRYKKMYRKCKKSKATQNKVSPISLNNIRNLGDFFKCLGSGKDCLAKMFDSPAESLLMSFVAQAKTWISEITPNQSLLLLLLANKRQTPNLVRFNRIVVQAIAVNRITKSSELDMEIEVIEKEQFNLIAELNEKTSLTSNAAARQSLYDEMVWIAKTTAADHQKPFDESSEKHLTSLLDKRKNLNPSYLRVMARYVGLGLLKSTKEED